MDGFPQKMDGFPGKLVLILFPQQGYISPIRFPPYNILHHMGNAQVSPSISLALENAAKSIELKEPGKFVPILSPKYGYFFPADSHPMVSSTPWKIHGFSHQFPLASIPDTLELKVKYIKRRRGHECYFIKKEEYKYTLGKSIPPYTKLSLLLTISPKNYNSYPKISTKSAATVAFGRKVSEGYSFKKDSQFNSYFSIAM